MASREYNTLSEAMNDLRSKGFEDDLTEDVLRSDEGYFTINGVYRFEGMTDPADSSVLYTIVSDSGKKGIIVDTYTANSDPAKTRAIQKLRYNQNQI
jgi:hypothetical protein